MKLSARDMRGHISYPMPGNKARKVTASDEREVDFDRGGCLEDLVHVQDNSPLLLYKLSDLEGLQSSTCFRADFADIFLFTIQVFLPYTTSQLSFVTYPLCVMF